MKWEDFYNGLSAIEKPLVEQYLGVLYSIGARDVLEIGSGWGIFGRTAMEVPQVVLTSIDKIPIAGRPDFNDRVVGFEKRIDRIVGDSADALPLIKETGAQFDLIFVDGDHSYSACLSDMVQSWEMLRDGGVLMVDDIYHKNNWKRVDDDYDYGTGAALWEFIKANKDQVGDIKILPVGHGVVTIQKNG